MLDSISLFRIIKAGGLNVGRNVALSFAATFVTAATLFILTILLLILGIMSQSLSLVQERVDISVYLKADTAEAKIAHLKTQLEQNPLVEQVSFISSAEALANFKTRHSQDKALVDSLSELPENVLSATLRVRAKDINTYPQLAEAIEKGDGKEIIAKVNFEDNRLIIQRLSKAISLVMGAGLVILISFAALATLVNFNTIALAIYHRREEVEIMRLVGATNWYIRGPFLVEATIYASLATALAALATVPIYLKLLPFLSQQLGFSADLLAFFTWPKLVGLQLLVGLVISSLASLMAIRKYLKI